MKKIIFLFIIWFGFNGCLTVNRIARNCDKFAKICITEKVTETVYRDTTITITDTILVELPRDTVTITDTVTIINNRAYMLPVYKEFGLIGVRAGVVANVVNVRAWLTDSTILQPRTDTITINNAIKEKTATHTIVLPPEKYIPGFYKFTFWLFVVALFAVVLFVIAKIKNFSIQQVIKKVRGK